MIQSAAETLDLEVSMQGIAQRLGSLVAEDLKEIVGKGPLVRTAFAPDVDLLPFSCQSPLDEINQAGCCA